MNYFEKRFFLVISMFFIGFLNMYLFDICLNIKYLVIIKIVMI